MFDPRKLHAALDAARRERLEQGRAKSWRQLCTEAGISGGNIGAELLRGRMPTAGNLAKLLLWLHGEDHELGLRPYLTDDAQRG